MPTARTLVSTTVSVSEASTSTDPPGRTETCGAGTIVIPPTTSIPPPTSSPTAPAPPAARCHPTVLSFGRKPRRKPRRWSGTIPLALCAGASVLALSTPAVASPPPGPVQLASGSSVTAPCDAQRCQALDGFVIGWVPHGVGSLVTDFSYEWDDVAHRSRVWETGPDADGAYRVDLTVTVLRGERLHDIEAVRDYLADYLEHDPERWPLRTFRHRGRPGYHNGVEAFWLAEPGVAVRVRVDDERFTERQLMRTTLGVRPVRG